MLTCDYKVLSIDGDYAHLEHQDAAENEPKLVAVHCFLQRFMRDVSFIMR